MKQKILNCVSFFAGVSIGVALCTVAPKFTSETEEPISTNSFVVVTSPSETNRAGKTTYQVDWFKDNSNYIWDGWKIK